MVRRKVSDKVEPSQGKENLWALLLRKKGFKTPGVPVIKPVSREGELPLSFSQERFWFFAQLDPGNPSSNMFAAFQVTGCLDQEILEQSFTEIIRRHEILRTNFENRQGKAFQVIHPPYPFRPLETDLVGLSEVEQRSEVSRLAIEEARRPFDLAHDSLLRINLVKLASQNHVILFNMHHMISDGWSIGILIGEVVGLYKALLSGKRSPLSELPIQYIDYAQWQRESMTGEVFDDHLWYWKEKLRDSPPALQLPTDRPRSFDATFQAFPSQSQSFALSPVLTQALRDLSQKEETTLFMTLLACLNILFYRWTGKDDICVGSATAHRGQQSLENLIGYFINPLPLRTDLSGYPSFKEVLRRTREVCLGAFAHQDLPFELLAKNLHPEHAHPYMAFFRVLFILQNLPPSELVLPGLTLTPLESENEITDFDLSLELIETKDGLTGSFKYNADLFEIETIRRMMEDFRRLLKAMVANPEEGIELLPLSRAKALAAPGPMPLLPKDESHSVLSHGQRALWFLYQLAPQSAAYNIVNAVRIRGEIDLPALHRALQKLVDRHPSLRTTFFVSEGKPIQRIHEQMSLCFEEHDLSGCGEESLQEALKRESSRPFDLENGPLFKVQLFKRSHEDHVLLLSFHHIIADFWSQVVLMRELNLLYPAEKDHAPCPLPSLSFQYTDYIRRQEEHLLSPAGERNWKYWKEQLQGEPSLLNLPTDHPWPSMQTFRGASRSFRMSGEVTQKLKALGEAHGASLYMTLLAAFETLLFRYCGQEKFLIGSPKHGRNREELKGLVGYLTNPLVLKADFSGDPTFQEFLAQVRQNVLAAFDHQDSPFSFLAERLKYDRNASRSPLFQVMFVLQKAHWLHPEGLTELILNKPGVTLEIGGLKMESIPLEEEVAQFDLTLVVSETHEGLLASFEYNTDIFEAATMDQMEQNFLTLIQGIVASPEERVSKLPLLPEAEGHRILEEWNNTQSDYSLDKCIHQLFEEQVEKTPAKIAVAYDNQELTYKEVNSRANQLAHYLKKFGAGPGVPVGICVERSPEMIVGILGILKAGGAYVPLDPNFPKDRIEFMLDDTRSSVILTQEKFKEEFSINGDRKIICLDTDWKFITRESKENPEGKATPEDLAYVIYTSGSTGKPKGVLIQHQSLVNVTQATLKEYSIGREDRILQFASISWDTAAEEIYPALSTGATLVLRTDKMLGTISDFFKACQEQSLTVVNLPTAFWHDLTETLIKEELSVPSILRLVIIGGERANPESVQKWQVYVGEHPRLVNTFGATEACAVTTICDLSKLQVDAKKMHEVPIGRPIANTQTYVLDQNFNPVPIGVPGELFIGGVGLARGYSNNLELTQEKFIPNPFYPEKGSRLYKTGDLARILPDGNIEYRGRIDHQVKIRGFRIELGEIETVISLHPKVRERIVLAREDESGQKRLVAYVVVDEGRGARGEGEELTISALRSFLKQKIPDYMIPSAFVFLEKLPLTPHGKVDRRALPAPEKIRPELEDTFVAPRNPAEEILCGIFSQVLGLEKVGMNDNFFELGGHSLLATQAISRVRQAFEVEVPLRNLFESPTVAGIARIVAEAREAGAGVTAHSIQAVSREGELPLSFAQERLWFLDQLESGSPFYNMPAAVRLNGVLDVPALEMSFTEVTRRHEALRTTFGTVEGKPLQMIHEAMSFPIARLDLSNLPSVEREAEVLRLAEEEAQRPFNLAHGPLIRATLIKLGEAEHVIFLTMHHVVSDAWSIGIFIREIASLYDAFSKGEHTSLTELPIQYADFAHWQRKYLQEEVLEKQLTYWKKQLEGISALLELPTNRPRPPVQTYRGTSQSFTISKEVTFALKELSQREGVTLFMTLLAAFQTLLYRYTGQEDIVVGSPIANRNWKEIEPLIGFFVNTLVLRANFFENPSFKELLHRVREACLGAYAHQDLPFEKLVEEINPERNLSHSALFQAMFVFQNAPIEEIRLEGVTLSSLEMETGVAKFDLTLLMEESPEGLVGSIEYKTDLFDDSTIQRVIGHFQVLLEAIVSNPNGNISSLPILTEKERNQVLVEWNNTHRDYPQDKWIHQLFEEQVEKTPNKVAVVYENKSLMFRELNDQANRLANLIQEIEK